MIAQVPHRSVFLLLLIAAAICATPAIAAPPAAPTDFTFTWNASGLIECSWRDRSNNELGFILAYRTDSAASWNNFTTLAANTTTYTTTLTSWTGCLIYEWTVVAYKGTTPNQEYGFFEPPLEVVAPPRISSATYTSGLIGSPFHHQITGDCASGGTAAYAASPLPAGLTLDTATGSITGTPTAPGLTTTNVTATWTAGTASQQLRIRIFRPVPALVAPVNGTPLTDRTLRRNAAPVQVDLAAHFNDPDVTAASRIVFNTGTIDLVYFPTAAPATVANFQGYISRGDYVNTIIHRREAGFVLQGGGYKAAAGAPSITRQPPVVNEPEISNTRGTVAMAKSANDPNSATSEYFISLADNSSNLNNQNEGFTVFARVAGNGMAVADAIASLSIQDYSSTNGALNHCPVTDPPPAAFDPASLVKVISAGPVGALAYSVQSSAPGVCGVALNGAQLTLTPLTAGAATISVAATDLDNQAVTPTFTVTVEEHLSDWLTAQNFPAPADAAATADPDADGVESIMEFGLMTNPQSAAVRPAPQASTVSVSDSRYLALTFPVRKFTGAGFVYTVEGHDSLTGIWVSLWTSAGGFAHALVVNSTDQPDRTTVTVRDSVAITSGAGRFLRLRVTDTP